MEGGGRKRCLVSGEGDFSFTCHVALQMVTLLGSSGSPLPELTPLTWGWGGREGGWRRMAPVGGGGRGRGRRKEGRADQAAGWWISLRGFPTLALSPAGGGGGGGGYDSDGGSGGRAGDSTFKMAPAGLASDVTRRAEPPGWAGGAGRGCGGERRGRGGGAAWRAPGPAPPRPARCVPAGPARAFLVPGCSPHSAPTVCTSPRYCCASVPTPSRQCLHSGAGSVVQLTCSLVRVDGVLCLFREYSYCIAT